MVKLTIKLADDSPENKKWVCKRTDDDPQLEPKEETDGGSSDSLPEVNPYEESENVENWYPDVSSYLKIEMKEIKSRKSSCGSSTEKNKNILETQDPAHSIGIADMAGNFCNVPMDLSRSYSEHKSQRDATNNVPNKSPIGAHSSKSKPLENFYGDFRNAPSLSGPNRIIQGEIASHFPRDVGPHNFSLFPNQRLVNSGEVASMAVRTMPSTTQNFPITNHRNFPITSGFVNSEKPEITAKGNIPHHLQQEEPRPLKTNYRHFSADSRSYGDYRNASNSDANRSYNRPLESESNATGLPIRNEFSERVGGNSVNDLAQKHTNYLKRLSQTCPPKGSNDALESVLPPKRKKSHAEVPGTTYYCNVCDVTYKTDNGYSKHLLSEKHLRKMNLANQPVSYLYNFQPNSVSRSFGPTVLETQPQPHPHLPYLMGNQMFYHQMSQARAMTVTNQSGDGRTIINNTNVQKFYPGRSKSDCKEEFLDHNRSHNDLEAKRYAQDPRHMILPVNHSSNPQGIFSLPRYHQSENSTMANPKYLENKAPQSIRCPKNPSSQNQPENVSVWNIMAKSDPCAIKPKQDQQENLTVSGSFQKSEGVQSLPHDQFEFFRVYNCLVCSTFQTNNLQELVEHVSIDRSKTPFELINVSGHDLYCKLCDFKTQISVEMGYHCGSKVHLNRVNYYNHVMEGGIHMKEKLMNLHAISQVFLFCSACEFYTQSMDTLKAHSIDPSHQHNVSCCMYLSNFSQAVEYCYCRPCNVRTPTKRELLLHVRSQYHMKTLGQYSSKDKTFHDPARLFFVKEFSLKRNELPRVSEQTEGSTFVEREKPHLRKENNQTKDFQENPAPLNLNSAPSASLEPLPVSCCLCQQILPELNVLVQHFHQIHGVNEVGVKWLISTTTKVHEEKSSTTEEVTNTKEGKLKSIVLSPQKSSATDKTLAIQGMSIDSSSSQCSVAAGQNVESKSSACFKAVTSEQNMEIDENLNQKKRTNTESSSSQQLCKTENVQNPDDLNSERRTGKDFFSSHQLCETRRMQNPGISSIESFASQQFCEKEGMRNLIEPNQIPDFDQERVNIDPPSSHQFHETENMHPVGEESVSNSEENLNYSSSLAEVIAETESEPNGDSKDETQTDDSSSELFQATEHGLLISQSGLNARRKGNDFSPRDHNPSSEQQFHKSENMQSLGEEKVPNSEENLNSCSSQAEVIVEYESEPNRDGNYETETGDSSSEPSSASNHGSPVPLSDHNASRERNDSSSSHNNSVTPERLLAIYDSSNAQTSPISQSCLNASREWYDSSSSDHNSLSHERLPLTDDFSSDEHRLPISQSGLNVSRERNDFSLSDHNSVTDQRSLSTDDSASEHFFATVHESPQLQSGLNARRKRNDSFSSDDIFVEYERLPGSAEKSGINFSPSQHYLLDSGNTRSTLEDQENLDLRENSVNVSPISKRTALVNLKEPYNNISVMSQNSEASVNDQIALYDCPNQYEEVFSAPNSPSIDPQLQARKNIENIEISGVFSLASSVGNSNNTNEEEESSDFEGFTFSDMEEL